jgi:DNA-binding transcriptional ArsR family regulator
MPATWPERSATQLERPGIPNTPAERSTASERDPDVLATMLLEPQRASVSLSEASDPRDAATLSFVRERFGRGLLTAELLADELGIGRSTADRWVSAWREAGQIEALKQRGLYRLTEGSQS